MNILRRIGLAVCAAILGISLLGIAWSHTSVATLQDRSTVKGWLHESGFYDKVVEAVLQNAEGQAELGQNIPVGDPAVQAVVKDAFNPQFLRENAEKVLDGVYSWLEGDTARPEFSVDIGGAKQRVAEGVGEYARITAAGLPACTPEQLAQFTSGFDVFSATCLPPGVTPEQAGAEVRASILANEDFLGDTMFTGDDLTVSVDGQETTLDNTDFRQLQQAYRFSTLAPFVFALAAVVLAAGMLFLSPTKRQGVRRAGSVLLASGIVLGLTYLIASRGSSALSRYAEDISSQTDAGRDLAVSLANAITRDISGFLMWYAIVFGILGIVALLGAAFLKKSSKKPSPSIFSEPAPPVDDSAKTEVPAVKSGPTSAPVAKNKPAARPAGTANRPAVKRPKQPPKIQL